MVRISPLDCSRRMPTLTHKDTPLQITTPFGADGVLTRFKPACSSGSLDRNFNVMVFNDKLGNEQDAIHPERNLSLNSEGDKMIRGGKHKGKRVAVCNVMTLGKLVPGGGIGGGDFGEGDPLPQPAPTGVLGLNAVATYGDNFQMAFPL